MQVTKALIAAMALAAAGCGQPKSRPSPAVATINGQPITAAELDKQVGSELQQLDDQYHKQVYQTKRQALEGMIQKRVFEAKAKEAGAASPEELIQKEMPPRFPTRPTPRSSPSTTAPWRAASSFRPSSR